MSFTILEKDKNELKKVPNPYSDLVKSHCIVFDECISDSNLLSNLNFDSTSYKDICKVGTCNKLITRIKLRLHVGWHILRGDVIPDPSRCGFCGLVGHQVELRPASGAGKNKKYKPWSACEYNFSFDFKKNYEEVVPSYPCSNRPIKCDQCLGIYWTIILMNTIQ